jgi:hypothetical protein
MKKYFETSGPYTVCSIGGAFGSAEAVYEAWYGKENLEVNLPTSEAARDMCRAHAKQLKVAA